MKLFRQTTKHESDESLMTAIAGGNERAFAELYDRYGPRMYRFFLKMLWRNPAHAEDLTQELFIRVIEKAAFFNPERSFRTWIYVLAFNLCKNEFRRPTLPEQLPGYENDPQNRLEEDLDRQLFDRHLQASIDQLSPAHRQCFVLRYQEELPVAEIAEITGCPEGTVKSRLHHALLQVCRQMEGWKIIAS